MSNINPYSINGSYPIAGQDNDTQGFRDNFTNIRNNFLFAKEEIEELQNGEITQLTNVKQTGSTYTAKDLTNTASNNLSMQFNEAHMYKATTFGTMNLQLSWDGAASGVEARMTLWLDVTNVVHTLMLPATVTVGRNEVNVSSGYEVVFPNPGQYLFEFVTMDGGINVAVSEVTKKLHSPRIIKTPPLNTLGSAGDLPGTLAYNSSYIFLCTANYDGVSAIWKRVTIGESIAYISTIDNVDAVFSWQEYAEDSRVQLWINVTSTQHKLCLPASVTVGKDEILGLANTATGAEITFPETGHYLFEFLTHDGGTTVAVTELTKKITQLRVRRDPPLSSIGAAGDKAGMIAYNSFYTFVCTANYDGTTAIWKRTTLESF